MDKKTFVCAASAVGMALVLCACNGNGSFIDKGKLKEESNTGVVSVGRVSALDGFTYSSSEDDLALFTKTDGGNTAYKVYDIDDNKVVFERTGTSNVDYSVSLADSGVISVASASGSDSEIKYSVYAHDGSAIFENRGSIDFKYDCVVSDGTVWRINEQTGTVKEKFERSLTAGGLPSGISGYSNGYYYTRTSSSSIKGVTTYDGEFNVTGTWYAPVNIDGFSANMLKDGTVFVQYAEVLPTDAKDYDVFSDGDKFNMHTVKINPKNGKASEFNADYMVSGVSVNNGGNAIIKDSIDNIAQVIPFDDHMLQYDKAGIYELTNGGKLGDRIDAYNGISAQYDPIGNGYVQVETANQTLLLDSELKEVGDVSGISHFGRYLVNGNGIFDYSLNRMIDLTATGGSQVVDGVPVGTGTNYKNYSYSTSVDGYPIYTEHVSSSTNYYRFYDGKFVKIDDYSGSVGEMYYTYGSGVYTYYTADGNKVCEVKTTMSSVCSYDDCKMLRGSNDGSYVYYNVSGIKF